MTLTIRPYQPADESACLSIFDGNTPKFFGIEERPKFESFLKRQSCPYFVVEQAAELVACGGYSADFTPGAIVLAWGMVRNNLHKHGLGTFLLKERLARIFAENPAARVIIDTSQHTQSFFARFGFKATKTTPDYYAPGLHRVDMELELTDNLRRMLAD